MALINSEIKPFSATAYKSGEFVDVSDADVKGKWAIFFFYPADFTFVCPTELGDLADNYEDLKGLGVEVFSVSTDTHFSHKAWHDSSDTIGKIDYYMIGDPTTQISQNFDVLREGQGLADRGTFVIDPDGVIQVMEITAEGVGRNAAELVRKVKAAQYVARPPRRGLPRQVGRGRQHPHPGSRPRRQDLTHPFLAGSIGDPCGHRSSHRRQQSRRPTPERTPDGARHAHARRQPDRPADEPLRADHPTGRAGVIAR